MNIYHTDVRQEIVSRVQSEFGSAENLKITGRSGRLSKRNWSAIDYYLQSRKGESVFGFKPDMSLDQLMVINRNGHYHHFTKYIIEKIAPLYKGQLAYLHIDQHTDFSNPYAHAHFVSEIFYELGIPVYILVQALGYKEIPNTKPKNGLRLIKPLSPGETDPNSFDFDDSTKAICTNKISEKNVYVSTDLDAFPSRIFLTEWPTCSLDYLEAEETGIQIQDFTIDSFKSSLQKVTQIPSIVGCDFTGLSLLELDTPEKDSYYLDPPHVSLLDGLSIAEYKEGVLSDVKKQNSRFKLANDTSIDNLIELMKFMHGLMN